MWFTSSKAAAAAHGSDGRSRLRIFAYEFGTIEAKKFIICDLPYIWKLINTKFTKSPHFYEVLFDDLSYTLYLDINDTSHDEDPFRESILVRILSVLNDTGNAQSYIVLDFSPAQKRSYHIIFPNIQFRSSEQTKTFVLSI